MVRTPWAALLVALALGCATQNFAGEDDASFEDPADVGATPPDDDGALAFDVVIPSPDVVAEDPDAESAPDVKSAPDAAAPGLDAAVEDVVTAPDAPPALDRAVICGLGTVRCGDRCATLTADPEHCGRCGNRCAIGQSCAGGFCEDPCPAPRSVCNGLCTDTSVDPEHCGRCGNRCAAGAVCAGGACVTRCAAPRVQCGASCVDVASDAANCGACGNRCATGSSCAAGRCSAPTGTAGVGAACARTSDCLPGWICQPAVLGWPDGYCVRPSCARDSDCGAGGTCFIGSTQSACFAGCVSSSQCRAGYACVRPDPTDPVGLCYPNCALNVPVVCGEYACNARTSLCTGGCSSSLECSNGSVCRAGDCYCTSLTNCGPNRRCYVSPYGACGCANDLACGPDARCDTTTGECVGR